MGRARISLTVAELTSSNGEVFGHVTRLITENGVTTTTVQSIGSDAPAKAKSKTKRRAALKSEAPHE